MHGSGLMINTDGTQYEGEWKKNQMHGVGAYVDADKTIWEGIFVDNSYQS